MTLFDVEWWLVQTGTTTIADAGERIKARLEASRFSVIAEIQLGHGLSARVVDEAVTVLAMAHDFNRAFPLRAIPAMPAL